MRNLMVVAVLVTCLGLFGCAEKADAPLNPWAEGPYSKVRVYTDHYGVDFAEAWVSGELGDKLVLERGVLNFPKKFVTVGAHIVRKDKSRADLPIYVHNADESYRVRVIHLVDKADREFEFLRL